MKQGSEGFTRNVRNSGVSLFLARHVFLGSGHLILLGLSDGKKDDSVFQGKKRPDMERKGPPHFEWKLESFHCFPAFGDCVSTMGTIDGMRLAYCNEYADPCNASSLRPFTGEQAKQFFSPYDTLRSAP